MNTTAAPQEPLDRLQVELNNVVSSIYPTLAILRLHCKLFHVGRIFKTAHQGDSKAMHQAKTKAKDRIPEAQANFSECLDDLEKDLTDARMVLNRDLANLRNKRAEREKAAGAARLQNGQPKRVKAESTTESKSNTAGAQKAAKSNTAGDQKAIKTEQNAQQSNAGPEQPAAAAVPAGLDADLESMFTDDLSAIPGFDGVMNGVAASQAGASDVQMSTDALFSDGAMNIDGADFSALGGDQDDVRTLLPGLEKYVNQTQDNSGGANGQAAAGGTDDFDLEALLNDMTGGGDQAQGQDAPVPTASSAKENESSNSTNKDGKPDSNGNNNTNPTNATNGADIGANDIGTMDFSNENTFDIDFDELTAGAGDGTALPGNDDIGDWFNFD